MVLMNDRYCKLDDADEDDFVVVWYIWAKSRIASHYNFNSLAPRQDAEIANYTQGGVIADGNSWHGEFG
jgi:hypothetical protein